MSLLCTQLTYLYRRAGGTFCTSIPWSSYRLCKVTYSDITLNDCHIRCKEVPERITELNADICGGQKWYTKMQNTKVTEISKLLKQQSLELLGDYVDDKGQVFWFPKSKKTQFLDICFQVYYNKLLSE